MIDQIAIYSFNPMIILMGNCQFVYMYLSMLSSRIELTYLIFGELFIIILAPPCRLAKLSSQKIFFGFFLAGTSKILIIFLITFQMGRISYGNISIACNYVFSHQFIANSFIIGKASSSFLSFILDIFLPFFDFFLYFSSSSIYSAMSAGNY